MFNDDKNFFEIEEFRRQTLAQASQNHFASMYSGAGGGNQTRAMVGGSLSAIFAQGGSPDQPLRLGKGSPNKFTPGSIDQD